jgi:hypothetical protein
MLLLFAASGIGKACYCSVASKSGAKVNRFKDITAYFAKKMTETR